MGKALFTRTRLTALCTILALLLTSGAALAKAKVVYRGNPKSKQIAITIDDCWSKPQMERALKLAKKHNVKFTFFPVGQAIQNQPKVWKKVDSAGHEIGNHTYSHKSLTKLSQKGIEKELTGMSRALDKALGYKYPLKLMRPPYGNGGYYKRVHKPMLAAMDKLGYQSAVMWTADSNNPKTVLKQTGKGGILLFHATPQSIKCLETVLPQLIKKGYAPVTVSQLLGG